MKVILTGLLISVLLAKIAVANELPADKYLSQLLKAHDFKCALKSGYQVKFDGDSIEEGVSKFASKPEESVINIVQLNIKEGSALLVGNSGSSPLELLVGESGLTFLEKTDSGNVNLYKIFSNKYERKFFFVNSRHPQLSSVKAVSMPSQYYGSCEVLN